MNEVLRRLEAAAAGHYKAAPVAFWGGTASMVRALEAAGLLEKDQADQLDAGICEIAL